MIKYSVIIVSYNSLELLKNCMASLYNAATDDTEIIVVDNNSYNDVIEYLEQQKRIILIKNKVNLGFGRANNLGAKIATGQRLVLLNNDTVIPKDFFTKADDFFKLNNDCSIMGPLVVSADNFPQPTFYNKDYFRLHIFPTKSFRTFNKVLTLSDDQEKKKKILAQNSRKYSFVVAHQVETLSGVCLFIDRKVYEDVGLFDEYYFMYVEDLDFCLQAKRKGYKLYFNPEIMITHYIKSIKKKPSVSWFQYNNNLKYFFRKNFPFYINLVAQPILTIKAGLKFLISKT